MGAAFQLVAFGPLKSCSPGSQGRSRVACHLQVYMRRKRWVLALEAVKRAAGIGGPGSPEAHCMVLRFCHAAQSEQVGHLAQLSGSTYQHCVLSCWA